MSQHISVCFVSVCQIHMCVCLWIYMYTLLICVCVSVGIWVCKDMQVYGCVCVYVGVYMRASVNMYLFVVTMCTINICTVGPE